jgi:hypothetical protein
MKSARLLPTTPRKMRMTLRWAMGRRATGRASPISIFMLFMAPFKRDHTRQASQRAIFELSSLASFCFLGGSPPGITLCFFRLRKSMTDLISFVMLASLHLLSLKHSRDPHRPTNHTAALELSFLDSTLTKMTTTFGCHHRGHDMPDWI